MTSNSVLDQVFVSLCFISHLSYSKSLPLVCQLPIDALRYAPTKPLKHIQAVVKLSSMIIQ